MQNLYCSALAQLFFSMLNCNGCKMIYSLYSEWCRLRNFSFASIVFAHVFSGSLLPFIFCVSCFVYFCFCYVRPLCEWCMYVQIAHVYHRKNNEIIDGYVYIKLYCDYVYIKLLCTISCYRGSCMS